MTMKQPCYSVSQQAPAATAVSAERVVFTQACRACRACSQCPADALHNALQASEPCLPSSEHQASCFGKRCRACRALFLLHAKGMNKAALRSLRRVELNGGDVRDNALHALHFDKCPGESAFVLQGNLQGIAQGHLQGIAQGTETLAAKGGVA